MVNNKTGNKLKHVTSGQFPSSKIRLRQNYLINAESSNTQAIIATLAYFDIFDYPLTEQEIIKYASQKITKKEIQEVVKKNNIQQISAYYVLRGREKIVATRLEREKISKKKLEKVQRILHVLTKISTILYVGISGSLAMGNAKENDDIDLFIITKSNTLWTSRFVVNCILLFSGKLRRFGAIQTKNTICTNMWIDADHMTFPKERQNVYTAHEITQLLSVYDRSFVYDTFLLKNTWIEQFFPNINSKKQKIISISAPSPFPLLERWIKKLQLAYMKKHMTSETISDGFVAFHPKDYTYTILKKWEKRKNEI